MFEDDISYHKLVEVVSPLPQVEFVCMFADAGAVHAYISQADITPIILLFQVLK
jgi:hypothetical protein